MKILVTGGAGFIGCNFVHYMLEKHPEDEIVNLDLLTYAGNLESLADVADAKNYHFVKGDIADMEFIDSLFSKEHFDVVVNFAAETHVDRSITDPGVFVRTNVMGTQALLDASRKYGVVRYHQVSTDEVYGDLPLERKDLFFTEETPTAHFKSVLGEQGGFRPACSFVFPHVRAAGNNIALFQQLWRISVSGKNDSAYVYQGI